MSASGPYSNEDAKDHKVEMGADSQMAADENPKLGEVLEDNEVFQSGAGQADFRALGWMRTAIILMKLCFATGVLTIPSAFGQVGYGPGIVLLFIWGALCTFHNIADAAGVMGGPIAREVASVLFLLTWILATGSSLLGLAQGLKILANGKVCTVVWTLIAALCTALSASVRTLGKLAILTWIGFASIFTAVFIVVWLRVNANVHAGHR
ncbi:hypothetical protein SLS62_000322 [Diatrype stigma]|uniref:Amino acid transporter transmembrane domain-containing protein n=1 Tax=Diatrype stigma TaxID=117547 RepID=A0AAN9UYJ4_9PEZI